MPVIHAVTTSLLRIELDERVDSHDRHTRLDGTLQLLYLAHARLQHTCFQTVVHPALGEVETVVLVAFGSCHLFCVGVGGGRLGRVAGTGC